VMDWQDLMGRHVLQGLMNPAWPADFDGLRGIIRAQTEMHPLVAGGKIAARCGNSLILRGGLRYELNFRPDRIAIALMPDELQQEPLIRRGRFIMDDIEL